MNFLIPALTGQVTDMRLSSDEDLDPHEHFQVNLGEGPQREGEGPPIWTHNRRWRRRISLARRNKKEHSQARSENGDESATHNHFEDCDSSAASSSWSLSESLSPETSAEASEKRDERWDVGLAARRILRDLSPENFQDSMVLLRSLSLSTEESLRQLVNLIFQQAMTSPHYSGLYVNICRCLAPVRVPSSVEPSDKVSFRTLLVRLCRAEYNRLFGERRWEATPHHTVQTIKFIGELYRTKILSGDVMHSCIRRLLQQQQEQESLECLCELLSIVGQSLELVTPKRVMDSYYDQMDAVARDPGTSPRTALMLRSTIQSRKKSLLGPKPSEVPGTSANVPTTEDEVPLVGATEEDVHQGAAALAAAMGEEPVGFEPYRLFPESPCSYFRSREQGKEPVACRCYFGPCLLRRIIET